MWVGMLGLMQGENMTRVAGRGVHTTDNVDVTLGRNRWNVKRAYEKVCYAKRLASAATSAGREAADSL